MRSAHCLSATGKLQASALAGVKPDSSTLHAATLKHRERVIDEFNPTALEKMPPDELAKQVRAYVGEHVRRESLSLNQEELDLFSDEIVARLWSAQAAVEGSDVTDILINTQALLHRTLSDNCRRPTATSRMRRTSCTSSTGSSRRQDGGARNRRPWSSTRSCAMPRASMSRSGRSLSTGR
jgi:hypothetical protein